MFSSHKMFITLTCTVHKTTMRCSKRFSTITNRKSKTAYELEAYMEKKNMISKIKNHKLCCIVIILALLGGGGFGIYKFFFQKKQPQKMVQTQKATTGTIEKTVEGSGSVKAITQNVTFSSDVTVQSVLKKDGAAVKKGDVIAKLTSSDLEDSITQLESQIETLEDTIEGSDSSDDDYASNVRKYKDLTMKLSTLKTERSNLTVTSKYNGIVSGTITKGKTISKGQSVCKVLKTSSYKVTINVDELDIKSVKKGQSVTVTADAVEDKTFTGKVTKVSKVGSTSDGVATYPVTIQLSNAADLLPSMSVTATITTAKAENAVLVPVSAIQTKDGESYVTVVTDDNENGTQTKVETGIINDTYAQITSGVSEGDQVKTITRSSSSSDEKSDMKGGMDAPSGGGMQGGNKQGGGMSSGGKQ